jgi:hypothetical protein
MYRAHERCGIPGGRRRRHLGPSRSYVMLYVILQLLHRQLVARSGIVHRVAGTQCRHTRGTA